MKADALLALYERVAEAPGAILQLRRFVLDLAMRGRLSPTRADWNKTTLGAIGEWGSGGTPSRNNPDYYGGNIPWLVIGDLNESIVVSAETHITEEGLRSSSAKMVPPGAVLIAMYGSIGKLGVAGIPCATNQAIAHCIPDQSVVSTEFLVLLLRSLREKFLASGKGVAQQNISQKVLKGWPVVLPPVDEQHRIAAKVDELMALLDRLEDARSAREATRDRLTAATLFRLAAVDADPEAAHRHARFALTALPALTTGADQIKQLRRTILDLAIRGRLSEQRAADQPASVLLSQVNEQRALAGSGETTSAPKPSDVPFPIPPGWELSRLGDVCSKTGSGSTPRGGREVYQSSGIPFLRSQNIYNDGLRLDDVAYIDELTHKKMAGTRVQSGDLLLNITGGSIGRCAQVPKSFGEANISQHVAIIRPAVPETQRFLHCLILSPYFQSFVVGEQTGAGRGGLPKNRMDRIVVPIPPIEEQHRIVAKVDDLMSICDRMEGALQVADRTRVRLLEALLNDALSSDSTERKTA